MSTTGVCLMFLTSLATAEVNLELRPRQNTLATGEGLEVELFAVADGESPEAVSVIDAVLRWDPAVLRLEGYASNAAYPWFLFGFVNDDGADGLNSTFDDGNGFFEAVGPIQQPVMISPAGFRVTTFHFTALECASLTTVQLEPSMGKFSRTQVLRTGGDDVVGTLHAGEVRVSGVNRLWISDVSMLAGRTSAVLVSGEICEDPTYGVTITLEIVPRPGNVGTVSFTPAPPVDILEAGDPWPGTGTFSPFDTDTSFSIMLNGSVADNGTFMPSVLTYNGPLTLSPVQSSGDAAGVWQVRFANEFEPNEWEQGVPTLQTTGVIRIVSFGDGDGGGAIDLRDFSELQRCMTGAAAADGSPMYDPSPALRCGVYDEEDNGDVDITDFDAFESVMGGPEQ